MFKTENKSTTYRVEDEKHSHCAQNRNEQYYKSFVAVIKTRDNNHLLFLQWTVGQSIYVTKDTRVTKKLPTIDVSQKHLGHNMEKEY